MLLILNCLLICYTEKDTLSEMLAKSLADGRFDDQFGQPRHHARKKKHRQKNENDEKDDDGNTVSSSRHPRSSDRRRDDDSTVMSRVV